MGLSQPSGGTGPGTADLIVCAEASNLPFSDAQEEGFENRLAALLADELGVSLAYRWMDFGTTLRRHALLERGDCDLVMAVSEGQQGYLTTIAYYSSTHVFVYRSDAPFEIATLDDAVLRDLRVGVQMPAGANAGPAVEALAIRDLIGNAVHFAPDPERAQPLAGIVEAVAAGEVDLAIAWGPVAGYFAAQQAEDLRIVPVEPAIDPPFQPLTFSIAIGARPGEEALVDRLNLALADRWDDVQAILDEAHVLRLPQTRPSRSIASEDQTQALVNLGLVTPKLTESSATLGTYYVDLMGEGARLGALLAEGESPGTSDGRLPKVLLATSPTAEVAARAARRLAKTHDLAALIGGVGPGQVEALSTVAADTGTLFLNVGEVPLDTAARCASDAFHLAVSAERYLHALYDWFSREGGDSWYLVYEDSEQGAALAALASDLLAEPAAAGEPGPTLAGSAGMAPRALSYLDVLRDIAVLDPDVVLLLLAPEDQTDFLAQHQVSGEPAAIATYPHLEGQTRERLANIMLRAQNESLRYRVQLWEPTSGMADELTDGPADGAAGGAPPLNSRFAARWGRPMDPTAWTAYAAVASALALADELGTFSAAEAVHALEAGSVDLGLVKPLDGGQGAAPSFAADHTLHQALYVLEIDPHAQWSNRVSEQLALARQVAVLDEEGSVDTVDGQRSSPCP